MRLNGYSVDDEEYLSGVRAVAVALRNIKGPPMAIWAMGLSNKMEAGTIEDAITNMTDTVEKLRHVLDKSFGY